MREERRCEQSCTAMHHSGVDEPLLFFPSLWLGKKKKAREGVRRGWIPESLLSWTRKCLRFLCTLQSHPEEASRRAAPPQITCCSHRHPKITSRLDLSVFPAWVFSLSSCFLLLLLFCFRTWPSQGARNLCVCVFVWAQVASFLTPRR